MEADSNTEVLILSEGLKRQRSPDASSRGARKTPADPGAPQALGLALPCSYLPADHLRNGFQKTGQEKAFIKFQGQLAISLGALELQTEASPWLNSSIIMATNISQ